ncbi:MAG TPA: RagB/SusD family nutrient uptake outer membrane protein [Prolixibacteraceae bacterium]
MKKIFKIRYILLFLALTMQFSCSKYLELLPPNGLVREEFWKTKEDVQAVLMGAYQSFASMDGDLFTYGEARGDMVKAHGNWLGSDQSKLMQSDIYPKNPLCNWNKFYKVINYCNEVIENAPEVRKIDNTFTDFQLKGFLAEAYFLRSLSYFYLVRIFKDVPLVLTPTENDGVEFYLPQTKGEDVLAEMVKNLDEYRPFATDGYKTLDEVKGRATKGAFDALLADISLWNFDYEACIQYSDRLISNPDFVLMPSAKWFELYYPGNSLESIFEFQFDNKYNQSNATYGITNRYANQYLPSQRAVELFAFRYALERDRGEQKSIAILSEDNYIIWKYAGRADDGKTERSGLEQNSCNYIIYRMADIYLMKAEALSQLGRYDEANAALNIVRERAEVAPVSVNNSAIAFEDAIMDERALELAFEGKRWFDLLRMGRRNDYARKDKLIELIIANVASTQKRILSAKLTNPLGWYLPVFKDEIERNKNLVQNPYYIF